MSESARKYVLRTGALPFTSSIDYARELNEQQHAVVTGADGPCLVLAGAGSGKTRTLIFRVAYLLEKGVRPEEILLVTFTNKAAREMQSRVESLLQGRAKGLWCGTFHHIGNRLLRMYGKAIGLPDDFGILDEEDSRDLVKACVKASVRTVADAKFPKPSVVQSVLSFAINAQRPVADVVLKHYPYLASFIPDLERVGSAYKERKLRSNNLDYDDLLVRWIELMDKAPDIRERLTRQFRYCMVDEYQDTNVLQHRLIRLLSSGHGNVLVVGDDAQSIYSFRAAEIKNILDFPGDYAGARIFKMEHNYRSTRQILDLANHSIANNARQFPKTLKSHKEDGPLPQLVRVRDPRQEALFVAQRIIELHRESGYPLSEIAVLFRAHYLAAQLELELAKRGVPYLVRGGIRFFEQAHVKDVLAYLRLLANPSDEIAWSRALMLHPGIGAGYADRIYDLYRETGGALQAVAADDFGSKLPTRVKDGLASFKRVLRALLRADLQDHPDLLTEQVLENGYNKHVLLNFDNAQDRLEDLRQLVNFAHTYGTLKEFLADATLREGFKGETLAAGAAAEEPDDQLVLSTIHQAKGLEWRAVFVIGLAEGQFPHAKAMDSEEQIEEERRLFYVAATRAKDELFLMHPMTRFDFNAGTVINRPSPFVAELPEGVYDEVEIEESDEEETIYLD
ncbi:MAG: ATP-dependent DNA helicase PcrA [Candidatus Omnitrophica bacterium]|nr:ATP-dependent DNA helicase PcrA [Candidatus Omnitrophota bacterium]